jgi:hypothetical protein
MNAGGVEDAARFVLARASIAFERNLAGDAGQDTIRCVCLERASRIRPADAGDRDRTGFAGVCAGLNCTWIWTLCVKFHRNFKHPQMHFERSGNALTGQSLYRRGSRARAVFR